MIRYYIILTITISFFSCSNKETKQIKTEPTNPQEQNELSCCSENMPSRFSVSNPSDTTIILNANKTTKNGMVWIPSGIFIMGGDDQWARKDEQPLHKVILDGFFMDETPVTNAQFKAFVDETAYITTAEQIPDWEILKSQLPPGTPKPHDSILQPASLVFTPPNHPVGLNNHLVWWQWVTGANWKHPQGPATNLEGLESHPVVHVTWDDANAYAKWCGKRLPTEAEFEYASRGGLVRNIYPWGNELITVGEEKANSWEGEFPLENTYEDGFYTTSSVKSYPANGYGLYDIAGNVWEWCSDWYHYEYYNALPEEITNPTGPKSSFDPNETRVEKRVLRGGSYLCNDSYCSGFRSAARMKSDPYSSQSHVGFRCVSSK